MASKWLDLGSILVDEAGDIADTYNKIYLYIADKKNKERLEKPAVDRTTLGKWVFEAMCEKYEKEVKDGK